MGGIQVKRRELRVVDREKILMYWANHRNISRDVIYVTRVEESVTNIEKNMPQGVLFTAYSGYKLRFGDVPADYSEVYVYTPLEELDELRVRFPENKRRPNLFVLRSNTQLAKMSRGCVVPDPLIFVDLWNLGEWYSKEFVKAMRGKLF